LSLAAGGSPSCRLLSARTAPFKAVRLVSTRRQRAASVSFTLKWRLHIEAIHTSQARVSAPISANYADIAGDRPGSPFALKRAEASVCF
jgi:hypothetical protein